MIKNYHQSDMQIGGEHANFIKNVVKWIKDGHTSTDRCFVIAEGAEIFGGIAFASSDAEQAQILDFSLSAHLVDAGARFLCECLERIRAKSACYHLYNDSERFSSYRQAFLSAGFIVAQQKLSYRFTKSTVCNGADSFEYRAYADVGEQVFVNAVALVTQRTLDRADARAVQANGETAAATVLIKDLKEIDFQPQIWELAFVQNELVGLVVPSNFSGGWGAINYIGVAPAHRGNGYVDSLLRRGTRSLLAQGVTTVIADIDIENFPVKAALERCGYGFNTEEIILEKSN